MSFWYSPKHVNGSAFGILLQQKHGRSFCSGRIILDYSCLRDAPKKFDCKQSILDKFVVGVVRDANGLSSYKHLNSSQCIAHEESRLYYSAALRAALPWAETR